MPIYEYYCTDCEETFEKLVSIRGEDWTTCDGCGSICRKVISLVRRPVIRERVAISQEPVRRRSRDRAPLPYDRGGQVKEYEMEFGSTERNRLDELAAVE